jgi:N-acetylmuramoyl-L-alanine amidase
MNTLSDEEFEQIYGRKPVRRVKKKKIYWNRIIIALIILIGIVTGLVKLTALVVSKIKGDDTQKTNKVSNKCMQSTQAVKFELLQMQN